MGAAANNCLQIMAKLLLKQVLPLLLIAGVGLVAGSKSYGPCTSEQNNLKTSSAQAVLNCAKTHCGTSSKADQHKCICDHCKSEDAAAKTASCACGLSDENSAQACGIYEKLSNECKNSGAPALQRCIVTIIMCMLVVLFWQ